jgi:hypothetical protein
LEEETHEKSMHPLTPLMGLGSMIHPE